MDFRDVCELNDYWKDRPPAHVSLSGLVSFKDAAPATPTGVASLNVAESMIMNKKARPFRALPTYMQDFVKEVKRRGR
jgi:hypothetical protein